ncbi:MAG: twin-arginine translocase TatA/TatE family subunit [Flavobacteriales bacterium]
MFQTILFIGFPEIVMVLIIAVMLFGADKLPEIARTFGKTVRQMRNASDDIKREIMKPVDDVKKEVKNQTQEVTPFQEVKKEIAEAREEIEEFTRSPIKRDNM